MCRLRGVVAIAGVLMLAVAGCADLGFIDLRFQPNVDRKDTGEASLRRINSAEGWVEFFRDQISARREQNLGGFGRTDVQTLEDSVAFGAPAPGAPAGQDAPVGQAAPAADGFAGAADGAAGASGPGNFSSTNVQEFGVDESDVVKTDGEYLYMLVGSELRIIKAYPADAMAQVASVPLDGSNWSNSQLFLNGDRVIAITQPSIIFFNDVDVIDKSVDSATDEDERAPATFTVLSPVELIDEFGLYYDHQKTAVTLIDIADPTAPTVQAEWELDGYYVDSRMIDGVLHLVLKQSPRIPVELEVDDVDVTNIAKYIPSFSVSFEDGSDDTGMLIAWDDFYRPADPDGYNITTVVTLDTNDRTSVFSSVAIMADPGAIYASTSALYLTDPNFDYFGDYRETLDIHKFSLSKDGVQYQASGSVEGRLLNQFSLSEHEGYLRVATTTGQPWAWDAQISKNHIFVLGQSGEALEVVGAVEDIAPGEQIYAARFLGERGFLVTFRRVDPLFTIDLSNPTDPRVAGELKVPGFSEYIHPLGENHLLTLGRAATEEGMTLGLQLSIFDVSNFSDPQLVVTKEIGGRGTYSEAEHNHKAFVYYAQENLLAIPVDLYGDGWEHEFSGLQIYDISPESGITLRGQISTNPQPELDYPAYWGWSRGMFVEDVVYAVTEIGVHAALLSDPNTLLNSIEIEGSPNGGVGGIIFPAIDDPADGGFEDGATGSSDAGTSSEEPPLF